MLWITEYDETKDRELFRQDCLEEGEAIGAERMRKLISCLMSQNRIEDLEKVASDTHYTQKLLKEFNL